MLIGTAPATAAFTSVPITTTNSEQSFVVPSGIFQISISATGQSGNNSGFRTDPNVGRGGLVSAIKSVAPGDTLYAYVGSNSDGNFEGGGASDVRTISRSMSGSLASRILVAGGGGDPGEPGTLAEGGCCGGAGGSGGDAGSPGTAGTSAGAGSTAGTAGGGGSTLAPGNGGSGGSSPQTAAPCEVILDGQPGLGGSGPDGGFPGEGGVCSGNGGSAVGGEGGGGGDGYYGGGGGGGGGAGDPGDTPGSGGGGGGGGSSYVGPSLSSPSIGLAARGTEPQITFSYTQPDVEITTPAAGASYTVGRPVAAEFACTPGGAAVSSCSGSAPNGDSIDTSSLGTKTFTVTATDANGNQQTASVTYTVAKALPTLTTEASGPITLGGSIADTATLVGGHSPGGTITFRAYGPDDEACAAAPAYTSAAVPVSGNGAYASAPAFTPAAPGTYRFTASYSGDAENEAAVSPCNAASESVTVRKLITSTSPPPAPNPAPLAAPAPRVRISYSPNHPHAPNPRGGPRYTFRFTDQAPGTTFYCSLGRASFKPCHSPKVYRYLNRGRHVFRVRSVDASGAQSATQRVVFYAGKRLRGKPPR